MRGLGGRAAFTVAEPDERDDEEHFDQDEDGGSPPENVGKQAIGGLGEVGAGAEGRLRERTGAPGQGER